jgi:homoserine kinase
MPIIIPTMFTLRIPATSANLGPGFDCLGLALDLWNEVSFSVEGHKVTYMVKGAGATKLNRRRLNLVTKAFYRAYEVCGVTPPEGARIQSQNGIPPSSGLGSSAAAILAGLCGANEILGHPFDNGSLLKLGSDLEGHPDNIAPALLGGLVVSALVDDQIVTRRYVIPEITIVIATPIVNWPTHLARSVLPDSVSRSDAIFNISRTLLVVEALRHGDLNLLQQMMEDRLHQSYRLAQIPGGQAAWQAGRQFGACALSGAGPSVIAFIPERDANQALKGMLSAFKNNGVKAQGITTKPSLVGIH